MKYLMILLAFLLALSGCTASRVGLSEPTKASVTKPAAGTVLSGTTNGPSAPKPPPQSVHAAEPIEASFGGTGSLDRF